jgi:hypothetical protein
MQRLWLRWLSREGGGGYYDGCDDSGDDFEDSRHKP